MSTQLADRFTIVCDGPGRDGAPTHERSIIYERHHDAGRELLARNRKAADFADPDAGMRQFHRLESTELKCTLCDRTERLDDTTLDRLIVWAARQAAGSGVPLPAIQLRAVPGMVAGMLRDRPEWAPTRRGSDGN